MLRTLLLIISLIFLTGCATNYAERSEGRQFIHQMVTKHQFDQQQLTLLFTDVEPDQRIINIMKKPHEKVMPWYAYRSIFLTPQRAQEGALFWRQHEKALAYAQQKYGVPPEIIVSILGVETRYGKIQGTYQTLR